MANATYSGGVYVNYGSCALYLDIYETPDSANNGSWIRGVLTLAHSGSGSPYNGNASSWSMSLNGQGFSGSGGYNLPGNSSMTLLDNTIWVPHDANGYAAISVSGSFSGNGGWPIGSGSAGGTYTLQDFDRRPSTPTSCSATVNADKSITVTSAVVSSPAGTPTYYVQMASSTDYGATWSAWGGAIAMTGNSRNFVGLAKATTYKFRVWASNTDGSSGTVDSASVFLSAGGKYLSGTTWVDFPSVMFSTGGAWAEMPSIKYSTGGAWTDFQ